MGRIFKTSADPPRPTALACPGPPLPVDRFYTEDLFRRTAAGIPWGRVVLFPGKPQGYPASAKLAVGVALGFLIGT